MISCFFLIPLLAPPFPSPRVAVLGGAQTVVLERGHRPDLLALFGNPLGMVGQERGLWLETGKVWGGGLWESRGEEGGFLRGVRLSAHIRRASPESVWVNAPIFLGFLGLREPFPEADAQADLFLLRRRGDLALGGEVGYGVTRGGAFRSRGARTCVRAAGSLGAGWIGSRGALSLRLGIFWRRSSLRVSLDTTLAVSPTLTWGARWRGSWGALEGVFAGERVGGAFRLLYARRWEDAELWASAGPRYALTQGFEETFRAWGWLYGRLLPILRVGIELEGEYRSGFRANLPYRYLEDSWEGWEVHRRVGWALILGGATFVLERSGEGWRLGAELVGPVTLRVGYGAGEARLGVALPSGLTLFWGIGHNTFRLWIVSLLPGNLFPGKGA